jgi:hypothetical protein
MTVAYTRTTRNVELALSVMGQQIAALGLTISRDVPGNWQISAGRALELGFSPHAHPLHGGLEVGPAALEPR